MWLAWVGFNLSHSLGAMAFGAFILMIGTNRVSFAQQASVALPLALLVSTAYLCLAARYWFRTPIMGCALSVACFLVAWVLEAAV